MTQPCLVGSNLGLGLRTRANLEFELHSDGTRILPSVGLV